MRPGASATYTILFTNTGAAEAKELTLTDRFTSVLEGPSAVTVEIENLATPNSDGAPVWGTATSVPPSPSTTGALTSFSVPVGALKPGQRARVTYTLSVPAPTDKDDQNALAAADRDGFDLLNEVDATYKSGAGSTVVMYDDVAPDSVALELDLPGALGGTVWHNRIQNSAIDRGEPRLGGVKVVVTNTDTNRQVETLTRPDGSWGIDDYIPAAEYTIAFTLPDGYVGQFWRVLDGNHANGFGADKCSIEASETTCTFTHARTGENVAETNLDFGLITTVTHAVSGTVWLDSDSNGAVGPGEAVATGATMRLLWAGPDGNFETVEDNGSSQRTLSEDARGDTRNGGFDLTGMPPGRCRITLTGWPSTWQPVTGCGAWQDVRQGSTDTIEFELSSEADSSQALLFPMRLRPLPLPVGPGPEPNPVSPPVTPTASPTGTPTATPTPTAGPPPTSSPGPRPVVPSSPPRAPVVGVRGGDQRSPDNGSRSPRVFETGGGHAEDSRYRPRPSSTLGSVTRSSSAASGNSGDRHERGYRGTDSGWRGSGDMFDGRDADWGSGGEADWGSDSEPESRWGVDGDGVIGATSGGDDQGRPGAAEIMRCRRGEGVLPYTAGLLMLSLVAMGLMVRGIGRRRNDRHDQALPG